MRAAERHLRVCRACMCREEVQATSHHWAAEAVFPLYSAGEATLLAGDVLLCIDAPTGCHAAVSLQCNSRASHCTRGSLSLGLFAGPWPAVPIGRLPNCFS
ncbi:hypothetical protein TcCL_NonESM09578 [Trypanosoma cruzi]|nr:hypothetical protein TcCL_NonESM09578 [Trypanosoma cruzi]